jgi:hypothetical protein
MASGPSAWRSSCPWRSEATRFEDQAGDAEVGVEAGEAVDDGRDRPRHGGAVDDQQHGGVQQLGDLGGGGQLAGSRGAVEHAHDALDDRQVRAGGAWANSGPISSGPDRNASRLRPGRPHARAW